MRLIDADALIVYCNNLKDKTVDANDIARFPTARGWISVKDRLPKENKTVLVARKYVQPGHKERRYVETAERIGLDWVSVEDEYKVHRQFHTQPYAWMPLPEPPKEDT